MNLRRLRRRAFWIGVRSVFDLSGQRTLRDMRALAGEVAPPPPSWSWKPPTTQGTTAVNPLPPGTYITWG